MLSNFQMQTDHRFPVKSPDQVSVYKTRTSHLLNFVVSADIKMKIKESKKVDKYLALT